MNFILKFSSICKIRIDGLTFALEGLYVAGHVVDVTLKIVDHSFDLVKHFQLFIDFVIKTFYVITDYKIVLDTLGFKPI